MRIILLSFLLLSGCATDRVVVKNCEALVKDYFVCDEVK